MCLYTPLKYEKQLMQILNQLVNLGLKATHQIVSFLVENMPNV